MGKKIASDLRRHVVDARAVVEVDRAAPELLRTPTHRVGGRDPASGREPDRPRPPVLGQIPPFDVEVHGGVGGEVAQRLRGERGGEPHRVLVDRGNPRLIGSGAQLLDRPRDLAGIEADAGDDMRARPAGGRRRLPQLRIRQLVHLAREEGLPAAGEQQLRRQGGIRDVVGPGGHQAPSIRTGLRSSPIPSIDVTNCCPSSR
jgi:hypothetical protein